MKKKSNFISFSPEYFLFSGILMFLYYSFHRGFFLLSNFSSQSCDIIYLLSMSYFFATFDHKPLNTEWSSVANCIFQMLSFPSVDLFAT